MVPDVSSGSLGLYLHIPFCAAICSYCNFNRGLLDEALKARYVAAVAREIDAVGRRVTAELDHPRPADTIYFGGGTPSLLDPSEVGALIRACRDAFDVASGAEVTLEANPETVTAERAAAYLAAGVNRVSLGAQSFRDEELRRLGRIHSARRILDALASLRAAGVANVSLDLMMWLPGQSVADWMESVETLVAAGAEHASLYLLEIYPNAPLRDEMARAAWTQAPDDDAAVMYEEAIDRLARAGYEQYEISNFARPGRRSRHNLKYWTGGEWLGFGCGAHSTSAGARWSNVAATAVYVDRIEAGLDAATGLRLLDRDTALQEDLFMGLRLTEGIDLDRLTRHHAVDVWERFAGRLHDAFDAGLVVREGNRLRLTRRGLLLSNEVMAVFIDPTVR